jgi:hypothetical protein
MSVRITLIPCLAAALIFGGCENDKSTGSASDAKSTLVSSKWKLTSNTVSPAIDLDENGVMITDLWITVSDCIKDDVTTYHANGTFSIDAGSTKCGNDNPQISKGTWSLSADGTTLTKTYDDMPEFKDVGKIATLTSTELKFTATGDGWLDGKVHTAIVGYTAQ